MIERGINSTSSRIVGGSDQTNNNYNSVASLTAAAAINNF